MGRRVGAGTRFGPQVPSPERSAFGVADDRPGNAPSRLAVSHHERFPALAEDPLVSPFAKRRQDRKEGFAALRQSILVAGSLSADVDPFENSVIDEMLQTPAQDVSCDAEMALEVREATQAEKRVPDDQEAPPVADDVEAASDGAILIIESGPTHAGKSTAVSGKRVA